MNEQTQTPFSFQSTPLCEGRPCATSYMDGEFWFQSTPLCEGRPICKPSPKNF